MDMVCHPAPGIQPDTQPNFPCLQVVGIKLKIPIREEHGLPVVAAVTKTRMGKWAYGIGSVLSFNLWADYTWSVPFLFKDKNFFDTLDFITANLMLPLGGLFIAIFAAWLMKESSTRDELNTYNIVYRIWYFLVKYITPIAVIIVFLSVIGVIDV